MPNLQIGILDLCIRSHGLSAAQALRQVFSSAQVADQLGFARYWIAEHHQPNSLHSAPEVLLGPLAASTSRIALGAGGMLLRYRDPYLLSQAFSLLEALYPGRIEFGVSSGQISGDASEFLRDADSADTSLLRKQQLLAALWRRPSAALRPGLTRVPLWMLGSHRSAPAAGAGGMNFCLDCFYRVPSRDEIMAGFRNYVEAFRRQTVSASPQYGLAVAGICADTDREAEMALSASAATGFPRSLISPTIVGSPSRWREAIEAIREEWSVRSFVVLIATNDIQVRRRSLELISSTFGLDNHADAHSQRMLPDGALATEAVA